MSTDRLVQFLQARLAEDEQAAQLAQRFHPSPWQLDPEVQTTMETGRWLADAASEGVLVANGDRAARHIARHDPARVLADVAAKQAILAEIVSCELDERSARILLLLAAPFADHPDCDVMWKP